MNWGKWIIVSFVLFAAFIGILVIVCVREDISLVSKNYYQEELAYQKQINRLNNTNQLLERPVMHVADGVLEIKFNDFGVVTHGELKLFRPSDLRFDKQFVLLATSDKTRQFDLRTFPKGMYRARMQWSMNGKEYFIENIINL